MNTTYLTKTRYFFASGCRKTDRHNRRAWIKSIRFLGNNWLLAKQIEHV